MIKLLMYAPTIVTMLLSVWAYQLFYGFYFSFFLVLLILLHELGHVAMAKLFHIRTAPPMFIPFLAAFVVLKDKPRSSYENSLISFGGPFAGLLGSFLFIGISFFVESIDVKRQILDLAGLNALINLFNMIPFSRLDGASMIKTFRKIDYWIICCVSVVFTATTLFLYHKISYWLVGFGIAFFVKTIQVLLHDPKKQKAKTLLERLRTEKPTPSELPPIEILSQKQVNISMMAYVVTLIGLSVCIVYVGR